MSPIDSDKNSAENIIPQFEELLVKSIKSLKERQIDISHKDLKKFVRFFCIKNAPTLGLTTEEAIQIAPYFFRYIYEDPEAAGKMWELLHKLSRYSTNQAALDAISTDIFETTNEGVTPMWQLTDKIVRGDISVESANVAGGEIYYVKTPSDSLKRKEDPERQKMADFLKEKVKGNIKCEPDLNIDEDTLKMGQQDKDLFFKIPRFMSEDSSAIINSTTWHDIIDEYFKGVTKHLISVSRILSVGEAKSDARKKRFKNFVIYVFQFYLKELMAYSKDLIDDKREKNRFASDLTFEHYLLSNHFLTNDYQEPDYRAIETRWARLFVEIKTYVEDNATLYGIRAIDLPDFSAPTAEKSVEEIQKDSADAFKKTVIGMPGIPEPAPKTEDRVKLEKADTVAIMVRNEFSYVPKRLNSSAMLAYPYIAVVPGSIAEKELIEAIKQDVDRIFTENADEIKSTKYSKNFVEKLNNIARNRASTKNSMSGFVSSVISKYRNLMQGLNEEESGNVFENISVLFDAIGNGLTFPSGIISKKKPAEEKIKIAMPQLRDLDFSISYMPSINSSSGEFENLKEFLKEKGLYERFLEIETMLREEMIIKDVKNMGAFEDLNTKFSSEESFKEAFAEYYGQKQKLIDEAITDVKKLTGNWFTKHFKFGRTKQIKEELDEYTAVLKKGINQTWGSVLSPMILQYGKIIFGSDLYVQKTLQNRTK